jgi:hypothetical protein
MVNHCCICDDNHKHLIMLIEALEEIKRNCEPWRTADNMAGRLFEIADQALKRQKVPEEYDCWV